VDDRRATAATLAILLIVITLPFLDVLTGRASLFRRDLGQYHVPLRQNVRAMLQSGELPQWDRLRNEGQPAAANVVYQLFYPPAWLTLLSPAVSMFNLHIVLHLHLAALGMFLLLRSRGSTLATAFIGAISFAFGGVMLSFVPFLPSLFGWAWVPWLVFFVERERGWIGAAVAMAMIAVIGEPFVLLQSIVILAMLRGRRRRAAIVVVAGVGLAAIQVLPALDLARRSARSAPFAWQVVSEWSLEPRRVFELLVPNMHRGAELPYLETIYCGIAIAAAALAGLLMRRGSWLPAIAAGAAAILVALGANTPLLRLLYDAHLFRSLRYPEKVVGLAAFILITFGASAIDAIVRGDRKLGLIAASIALLAAIVATPMRAIAAVLLFFAPRSKTAVILLALFVAVDLGARKHDMLARTAPRFFDPPPLLAQIPPGARIFNEVANERQRFQVSKAESLWEMRNDLYPLYPLIWNRGTAMAYDYDETELAVTHVFRAAAERARARQDPNWPDLYMAMSNAAVRIAGTEERSAGEQTSAARVVPAATPIGRYYFADRFEPLTSLLDSHGQRFPPRTAFVLGAAFRPAAGVVHRVVERVNSAELDVEARGPALLVASVTYDRDWRATVDGKPARILQMNVSHQEIGRASCRERV